MKSKLLIKNLTKSFLVIGTTLGLGLTLGTTIITPIEINQNINNESNILAPPTLTKGPTVTTTHNTATINFSTTSLESNARYWTIYLYLKSDPTTVLVQDRTVIYDISLLDHSALLDDEKINPNTNYIYDIYYDDSLTINNEIIKGQEFTTKSNVAPTPESSSLSTGAIIGIIGGSIVFLSLIGIGTWLYLKKKKTT